MKNYYITLLILLNTTLYSGTIANKQLSISNLNSTSHEIVNDPYTGKKLSELIWEAKNLKLLGLKFDYVLSELLFITIKYQTNITDGDSVMDDYDWIKDYTSEWSHWSNHPDTELDYLNILDISFTKHIKSNSTIKKSISFGYKIENKKFKAYNGTYIYSSDTGFRDLSGSFSGLGITYAETFKVLYIGLNVSKEHDDFTFNANLTYSPNVQATNSDTHHLRYFTNNNSFENTTMLGIKLGVEYKHNDDFLLAVGYSIVNYEETDGTTSRTYYDGATEAPPGTVYVYGGAGISNSYSSLEFSIIKKF